MNGKRLVYLAISLFSLIFAGSVLWIALEHNPQYEFYGSELGTDWVAITTLFVTYFFLSFSPLFLLAWLIFLKKGR